MKKIITLGPKDSYSDIATRRILSGLQGYDVSYVKTKEEIIPSIRENEVDGVVFPVQNKIIGDIGLHYLDDIILEILNSNRNLQIGGSINIPIKFALCGNADSNQVYVHPVAQKQCARFIQENGYEVILADSNPDAIIKGMKHNSLAIGDESYILKNGYNILKYNIQSESNNQTRFLYLGSQINSNQLDNSYHVYFVPLENKPNQLFKVISNISSMGINIEELVVRRRDCSNPKIKTGNAIIVCNCELRSPNINGCKKIGSLGLNWD